MLLSSLSCLRLTYVGRDRLADDAGDDLCGARQNPHCGRRSTTTPSAGMRTGAGRTWPVSKSVPAAAAEPSWWVWLMANTYSTSAERRTTTSTPAVAPIGAVTRAAAQTASTTARRPIASSSVLTYQALPSPRAARVIAAYPADGPSVYVASTIASVGTTGSDHRVPVNAPRLAPSRATCCSPSNGLNSSERTPSRSRKAPG